MTGAGILYGLWVALRHLVVTYVEDFKAGKKRYNTPEGIESRRGKDVRGIFTVQYPEEKLPVPEYFRFLPFLIYDEVDGKKNVRCTACGICAKVCPPQCIYIQRAVDPGTGKPAPTPAEYAIDIDLCMNCGFCAEFCPFDAVKMDHDYEISSSGSRAHHIYCKEKLLKPASYYATIQPLSYAVEEAARAQKEARNEKKPGG